MGIASALGWWDEWQLRVLVLASLFIYYVLNFSYTVRKLPNLRRLRVVIWIAYIGSDALAIYALATLFNRHKHPTTLMPPGEGGGGTTSTAATALEVTWVPVLLIHLAGHPTISAYSLEDNELWKRHAITFVSQVTVALYVFCKWWSGEKRLLQAAVLLFIVGILKFGQKPWALKTASFNNMLDSIPMTLREGKGEERDLTLEEYVHKAKGYVLDMKETVSQEVITISNKLLNYVWQLASSLLAGAEAGGLPLFKDKKMFVDMSAPYSVRLKELQYFMKLDDKDAHYMLQRCLADTFEHVYSRMRSVYKPLSAFLRTPIPSLCIASVVLLAKSNMDGYDKNDVRVTYILYCGCLLMEFLPAILTSFYLPFQCCRPMFSRRWHDMVSQCNLMSFCARKKKPTMLMKLATFSSLREYINLQVYIQQEPLARNITGLVRQHVKDGWKHDIGDADGYRRFNDIKRFDNQLGHLGWSSNVPFDHTVLLWHIATDLCFHAPAKFPRGDEDKRRGSRSREISNYMIYLLSSRPEMLMPGTRPCLFTIAGNEIELILKHSSAAPLDKEESLAREIINMAKSPSAIAKCSLIPDACRLAEALMKLGDEEMWMVIQATWVEMLCYSAVRCRGYLHAKSLGEGGECLTSIWLLWSFMGMETLADKLQRPHPSCYEADAGAPPPSQSQSREIFSPV